MKNGVLKSWIRGVVYRWYMLHWQNPEKPSYALSWEQDMEVSWEAKTWFLFQKCFKGMVSISLMEASIKIITRWYLVPFCPTNMFPHSSPLCFRGWGLLGSFLPTWWECPHIWGFWNRIFCLLCKLTGLTLQKTSEMALLNSKTVGCSKPIHKLIHFIFLGDKIMVARSWKQPTVSFAAANVFSWIMTLKLSGNLGRTIYSYLHVE